MLFHQASNNQHSASRVSHQQEVMHVVHERPQRNVKHELAGCWSRRIDKKHRLVYEIRKNEITRLRFLLAGITITTNNYNSA
jgi:mRNA-degrading endonuclease YafQ of YafQ-DinJ toxin-antitoxin module